MKNSHDSFFSMDRLVEFGMGMAMSQQIVQGMNNMMAAMRQPPLAQNVYTSLPVQQPVNPALNQQPVYQQYNGVRQVTPQQTSTSPAAFANAGVVSAQLTSKVSVEPPPVPQKETEASEMQRLSFSEVFYISLEKGKSEGPFSGTEIARLVAEKKVVAETPVWKPNQTEWKTAADFPELLALIALVPPKLPDAQ